MFSWTIAEGRAACAWHALVTLDRAGGEKANQRGMGKTFFVEEGRQGAAAG